MDSNMPLVIKIKVLRGLFFRSWPFQPGDVLEVSPIEASQLIASTRAELVDQEDRAVVFAAERREAEISAPMPKNLPNRWIHNY